MRAPFGGTAGTAGVPTAEGPAIGSGLAILGDDGRGDKLLDRRIERRRGGGFEAQRGIGHRRPGHDHPITQCGAGGHGGNRRLCSGRRHRGPSRWANRGRGRRGRQSGSLNRHIGGHGRLRPCREGWRRGRHLWRSGECGFRSRRRRCGHLSRGRRGRFRSRRRIRGRRWRVRDAQDTLRHAGSSLAGSRGRCSGLGAATKRIGAVAGLSAIAGKGLGGCADRRGSSGCRPRRQAGEIWGCRRRIGRTLWARAGRGTG